MAKPPDPSTPAEHATALAAWVIVAILTSPCWVPVVVVALLTLVHLLSSVIS